VLDHAWPTTASLLVRMAIHAGNAEARDGDTSGRLSTASRGSLRSATADAAVAFAVSG